MKINLRLFLSCSFLLLIVLTSIGQYRKEYGNVYYSVKDGDSWGGLIKMPNTKAVLDCPEKGEETVLSLSDGKSVSYAFACIFEAKTGDGKYFHKLLSGGMMWPNPEWTSPTGNTEITWVYFNKNAYEIFNGDPKPFDVELQFADGSAVKYFISPSY